MEYLITGPQVRQLEQGCPPAAVQEILGTLPSVERVSVDTDRTRRDEVSVWSTLALTLPKLLKVHTGSWFSKVCSGIYSIGSEIGEFVYFIGMVYGCMWGFDYIQSQWGSGVTAGMVATLVALTVVAVRVATSVISLIIALAEKDKLGEDEFYTPLSGHLITELQIQGLLESSPPGYVIKMLDSLPVIAYFEKGKTRPEETEVAASMIESGSAAPEKTPKWWEFAVAMIILASPLWLAFGSLLSEDPDTMATIGGYAVLASVANALICLAWARGSERLIAQRTSLTW